tara:strand:- start:9518 stop:9880 length:363 start_codon:yes stop_codon:yes gene_type:complete
MPSNTVTILSQTTHPGDSTVQTVTGDKFQGDGYYGRSDGFHTVQYDLNDFIGDLKMQGTLAVTPTSDDWFDITLDNGDVTVSYDDGETSAPAFNFTGNFVWVRVYVTYTQGQINQILLNH